MSDPLKITIIIGSLLIMALIIYFLVSHLIYKHFEKDALLTISYRYKVFKSGGKAYYETNYEKVEVVFIKVNKRSYLQFNSPTIYQIESNGKNKLVSYDFSKGYFKLVIIIPGQEKVKKAINENEVEFVTPYTKFDNFRVVRYQELSKFLGGI